MKEKIVFKSVSLREDNLKEIDILSQTLLPGVKLSKSQTITKMLDIVKLVVGKEGSE
jgi:hypothetical protein